MSALDLTAPARSESFRFDVLDRDLNVVGEARADASATPSITNDTDRAIKRTLDGMVLHPDDLPWIDPIGHRIQPVVILDGVEYPLGVFLFSGNDRKRSATRVTPSPTFVDQGAIFQAVCPSSVGFPAGTRHDAALLAVVTAAAPDLPLPPVIPVRTSRVGDTGKAWPAGTAWSTILNDLAGDAGLYSPHFDHVGQLRFTVPGDLDPDATDLDYDAPPSRIIAGSIAESDDTLAIPNRWVAIDSSATDNPVVGVYDVPSSEPFSAAARGYIITTTVDAPGVGNEANAINAARQAYRSSKAYEWVGFASPIDPRHDTWQTVRFEDRAWRETGWKLPCVVGGAMTHDLRRVL